jgi:hypothetical protein
LVIKKWKLVLLVFTLVIAGTVMIVQASSAEPGTDQDPLITKSYFDRYYELKIVEMVPGQKMILEAGSEFIIRSGKAVAITTESGGLADVTAGVDIKNGQVIPLNHLIIVPRDDGRGFKIMPEAVPSKAFVTVRGPYTVSSAN